MVCDSINERWTNCEGVIMSLTWGQLKELNAGTDDNLPVVFFLETCANDFAGYNIVDSFVSEILEEGGRLCLTHKYGHKD